MYQRCMMPDHQPAAVEFTVYIRRQNNGGNRSRIEYFFSDNKHRETIRYDTVDHGVIDIDAMVVAEYIRPAAGNRLMVDESACTGMHAYSIRVCP